MSNQFVQDSDDHRCIRCGKDALDTGWECTECGMDCRDFYYPQHALMSAIKDASHE